MFRRMLLFSLSLCLAVGLVAIPSISPSSLAQVAEQFEGEGLTRDTNKTRKLEDVVMTQENSLDKAAFDSGAEKIEQADDISVTTETSLAIKPIIILPGGLDHAAAGTGTRNAGFGTIRLRGVPAGSLVVRAWLYWATIYTNPAPLTATVVFNGVTVTGSRIGLTGEPCWLIPNASFAVYRANVRTLLTGAVNADYRVTGMASAVTNGRDAFTCTPPFAPPPTPTSEGASLVVIYAHSSVPANARVYLHQMPTLVTGTTTFTHPLIPVLPTFSTIKSTRLGGDGQVGCSTFATGSAFVVNATGENTLIGNTTAVMRQIRGNGSTINTDSDWNGHDGAPLNQLWDTHTDSFSSLNGVSLPMAAGNNQYVIQYAAIGDCIVPVVHVLGVR